MAEGTTTPPTWYPNPATQNVNSLPMDLAYSGVKHYPTDNLNAPGVGNDHTAPTVPTGLAASNVTATSLTLTWKASTDATGVQNYDVYQGGTKVGTTANLSANISGLTTATQYSFTIAARDYAGNVSAQSAALQVTTA